MDKDHIILLINEDLDSMDEEFRDEPYDIYFQPNEGQIYMSVSGMEYDGYDKEAYIIAKIENQEVVNWYI
ncbi:hypothetical protein [Nosocomiicoccus sp. HMSC059G07]|uniref:hypothetical protein n=1 Tax=Nosocomiicoccus sp. HMSC059G07 TaxID=1739531 RepID=UPI0008A4E30B|nr:hypothetical protein [Nosocomiicoccus sp. HMSC059G07]OFO55571.1 hypothetical protein HMPREF3029_03630 [Nosocomiicoccus sp. HMSC059G07]